MEERMDKGIYILDGDVKNPLPDRRKKNDYSGHPVWKKGTRVEVVPERGGECGRIYFPRHSLVMFRTTPWAPDVAWANKALDRLQTQGNAILPHLTPDTSLRGVLRSLGWYGRVDAESVLGVLLDSKRITLDDIRAAAAVLDNFDDDAVLAFDVRHGF
jgi:hypothetical protein